MRLVLVVWFSCFSFARPRLFALLLQRERGEKPTRGSKAQSVAAPKRQLDEKGLIFLQAVSGGCVESTQGGKLLQGLRPLRARFGAGGEAMPPFPSACVYLVLFWRAGLFR